MRLAILLLLIVLLLGLALPREVPPGFDAAIARGVQAGVGEAAGAALRATSTALYPPWTFVLTGLLVLAAWRWADRRLALVVLVGILGAQGASYGLKRLVLRQRPAPAVADGAAVHGHHAYPSGHVTFAAAALGSLALCVARGRGRRARGLAFLLAAAGTAWVALSRVWLGRHWPTDTLGGALLGAGVLLLVAALLASPTTRREVP